MPVMQAICLTMPLPSLPCTGETAVTLQMPLYKDTLLPYCKPANGGHRAQRSEAPVGCVQGY